MATRDAVTEAWRAAIGHAAGRPACKAPDGGCSTGGHLVRAYETARRQVHAQEAG
ncbi:hypothetical protein ABT174_38985 [Streptomyces sparsogenes]|uniref:hypothetical protein n=1 Tax=Streptomyces sparsogenes TaxID=67365 RepID=UPI0033309AA1